MRDEKTGELITSNTLKVHPRMKELYKFFKYNGKVMDIIDYDPEILGIFSGMVHDMITHNDHNWEKMVPQGIAEIIKEKNLFSQKENRIKALK